MKLSTTAALFALAAAKGATAVDFDFRDFEGLWESPSLVYVKGLGNAPNTVTGAESLGTVQCKATGDFRKAMCEFTAVFTEGDFCAAALGAQGPNAVADGKLILDQFDADTGKTKVLMLNVNCCNTNSTIGCAPMPNLGLGPGMVNAQFTMLPGKSNNHVRAIEAKFGTGTSSKPFDSLEAKVQYRKIAGGFKSYD